MRVSHVYDSSYLFHYILDLFYNFNIVNVQLISQEFEYDKSSIYKIIKKIDYNQELINSKFRVIKVKPLCYKFEINEL